MTASVNFVVLGEQTIASGLGKKGTCTDLTLYDKKESDIIRTWVVPNGFPDKIQPLFQAINLAEYPIFYVGSLDRFAGEQIVALDMLKKKEGILGHTYEVDGARFDAMIKGTVLERYQKAESDKLEQIVGEFKSIHVNGKTRVVIDHCFDVKGAGTIVLGKVESGRIRQYEDLKLLPSSLNVTIKSIQMHDDPVKEAIAPARVGIALSGAKPSDITRGDILSEDDSILTGSKLNLDFIKSSFYKKDITQGQTCLLNVGLQIRSVKFTSTSPLEITLDKPAVYDNTDICVLLKPESTGTRIMGSGTPV